MKRGTSSVTALIKELAKLSTVAVLAATTTLSVGTYNLESPIEIVDETVDLVEPVSTLQSVVPAEQAPRKNQSDLENSVRELAQSPRPTARPTSSLDVTTDASSKAAAQIEMVNQNAIRNLPITESLKKSISHAVGAVYGPGFKVQVYSGGQYDHETAKRLKQRRVGTKAHDHGHAADVYVTDPRGRRVTGNELAPLAQYWLATGKGGVGLEMRGGGIHLDEHLYGGRVRFWDYASDGGSISKVQLAALIAGKRGVMPELYKVAESAKADVLIKEDHSQTQAGAFANALGSNSVTLGATKSADGPIKIHSQYTLVEHRHWKAMLKAEYSTANKDGQANGYLTYDRDNWSASISAAPDEKPEFAIQWSYEF